MIDFATGIAAASFCAAAAEQKIQRKARPFAQIILIVQSRVIGITLFARRVKSRLIRLIEW